MEASTDTSLARTAISRAFDLSLATRFAADGQPLRGWIWGCHGAQFDLVWTDEKVNTGMN